MGLKLKELEGALQPLQRFADAKADLEQYPTSSHLASRMLFTALQSFREIEGQKVLDLGCGCGILSIASVICGADYVLGIDVDPPALQTAQENVVEAEIEGEIDFVLADVASLNTSESPLLERLKSGEFDTVIMNPPFGTKTKGIDMVFLEVASKVAKHAIYSLHKSSTRDYILKRATALGFRASVLAQMRYDLPKSMAFHKKATLDIEVDFIRFERITKK